MKKCKQNARKRPWVNLEEKRPESPCKSAKQSGSMETEKRTPTKLTENQLKLQEILIDKAAVKKVILGVEMSLSRLKLTMMISHQMVKTNNGKYEPEIIEGASVSKSCEKTKQVLNSIPDNLRTKF